MKTRVRRRKVIGQTAYYHVMSRTVAGQSLLGSREKEVFRKMLRRVAEFCGVRVITYAILSNHFHILVEIPVSEPLSDDELVSRFKRLYPKPTPHQPMNAVTLARILRQNTPQAQELRDHFRRRMHDLSWFMKILKQRYSIWYNQTHQRFGTLWSDRFHSVVVEGASHALRAVAAYIDLNPVRAGIVSDPKDYRFCGYGEAIGGSREAKAGLQTIDPDMAGYRQTLYGTGSSPREGAAILDRKTALMVVSQQRGKLPLPVLLRCRLRYLTEGMVLGSAEFVRQFATAESPGRKRPSRPHRLTGADWGNLTVLKGLRQNLFS